MLIAFFPARDAIMKTYKRRLGIYKAIKMTTRLIELIHSKIEEAYSPEQISDWLKEQKSADISYETIYQHIWSDKQSSGHLFKYLRRKGKFYQLRSKDKQAEDLLKTA